VLGEESYGKGLVQQTKDLAYNSKLKLTVAKYYTPSGRCIQRLDYSHRDEETGAVVAKADSLIKTFKTKNGRTVTDGRGISPDVEVKQEEGAHILASLVQNWVVFHWVTNYKTNHTSIDPASAFKLTDAEYYDFVNYAKSKEFQYETGTEQIFEELKKTAKEEHYYEGSEKQFEALFAQIEPKKEPDLTKFKSQIKEYLENEIVARYYYQTGRAQNALPMDPCIKRAAEVFSAGLQPILQGPANKN